jgi:hypothetical protein
MVSVRVPLPEIVAEPEAVAVKEPLPSGMLTVAVIEFHPQTKGSVTVKSPSEAAVPTVTEALLGPVKPGDESTGVTAADAAEVESAPVVKSVKTV